MLKKIAAAAATIVTAVLLFAASKPDTFRVQRVATIKAAPDKIFFQINDLHNWNAWSPWEKMDLTMKRTHSGAASGAGAVYEWDGNNKVGKGRMEITESLAPGKVMIKLDFIKPFEGHNVAEFTLTPKGGSTEVTWAMQGPMAFPAKVMSVFCSMDKMIGKDFEAGLANLKALAEK